MSLLLRKYRYFSSAIMYTGAARIEVPELWMVKVFLNRHEVEHLIRRQWHRSGSESMGIFCHDLREAVIKLAQPA